MEFAKKSAPLKQIGTSRNGVALQRCPRRRANDAPFVFARPLQCRDYNVRFESKFAQHLCGRRGHPAVPFPQTVKQAGDCPIHIRAQVRDGANGTEPKRGIVIGRDGQERSHGIGTEVRKGFNGCSIRILLCHPGKLRNCRFGGWPEQFKRVICADVKQSSVIAPGKRKTGFGANAIDTFAQILLPNWGRSVISESTSKGKGPRCCQCSSAP